MQRPHTQANRAERDACADTERAHASDTVHQHSAKHGASSYTQSPVDTSDHALKCRLELRRGKSSGVTTASCPKSCKCEAMQYFAREHQIERARRKQRIPHMPDDVCRLGDGKYPEHPEAIQ